MSQHQEKVGVSPKGNVSLSPRGPREQTARFNAVCPSVCRVDVVICLSTTVRNDTLQDGKEQRVSLKCRKQLRVEELEMVTHTPTH